MFKSYRLFDIHGIPIKVHGSLPLFLILAGLLINLGGGVSGFLLTVFLWTLAFGCVLLHELGHALAARHYGIPVREITLYPIGGVAALAFMPKDWRREFVIAIAGPAVNFALAALFALAYFLLPGVPGVFGGWLVAINLGLALFNLIPGFPMDGGRILRALLARRRSYFRATKIAVDVGRNVAIGMGVLGFLSIFMPLASPMLLPISIFIYFAAKAELARVALEERLGHADPLTSFFFPDAGTLSGRGTTFRRPEAPRVFTWTFRNEAPTSTPRGNGRIIDL